MTKEKFGINYFERLGGDELSESLILIADIHHVDDNELDWGNGYLVRKSDLERFK